MIELHRGNALDGLRCSGVVDELYDGVTLRGVRRPMALR